jgi:hypothetical protein
MKKPGEPGESVWDAGSVSGCDCLICLPLAGAVSDEGDHHAAPPVLAQLAIAARLGV